MPNEKYGNKGMELPHSIFGSRTRTNASGKPVVLQEITPLPHSEILNQRFKFGDSEKKPLHSQWMEMKGSSRSKKTCENSHVGASCHSEFKTIDPLHLPCNHRL